MTSNFLKSFVSSECLLHKVSKCSDISLRWHIRAVCAYVRMKIDLVGAINDIIIFILNKINGKNTHISDDSVFSLNASTDKWQRHNENEVCKSQKSHISMGETQVNFLLRLTFQALQNETLYFGCVRTLDGWTAVYWVVSSLRIVSHPQSHTVVTLVFIWNVLCVSVFVILWNLLSFIQ